MQYVTTDPATRYDQRLNCLVVKMRLYSARMANLLKTLARSQHIQAVNKAFADH